MINISTSDRSSKIALLALMLIIAVIVSAAPVFADMGPKPSVSVSVEGRPDETCYATLLSASEVSGPWHRVTDENMGMESMGLSGPEAEEVIRAFLEYSDPDGYILMNHMFTVNGNASFSWSYYPPKEFKIAIYVPSENRIYVSEKLEREAFDSYFKAVIPAASGGRAESLETMALETAEEIRAGKYIGGFALRLAVTLLVEVLLALLFKYRKKKEILTIIITNVITQGLLNLIMGVLDYLGGGLVWMFVFPVLEILVFVIELIVYLIAFKEHSKGKTFAYTLLANLLTLVLGFFSAALSMI